METTISATDARWAELTGWSADPFWIERRGEFARRWRTYRQAVNAAGEFNSQADRARWARVEEAYGRACVAIGAAGETDPITGLLF